MPAQSIQKGLPEHKLTILHLEALTGGRRERKRDISREGNKCLCQKSNNNNELKNKKQNLFPLDLPQGKQW